MCEHFNIDLSDDPEIRDDLLDILRTREEIAEIVATEDEFEIRYSMDICPPVPVLKEQYKDASQEDVDVALEEEGLHQAILKAISNLSSRKEELKDERKRHCLSHSWIPELI